jgi:uncharacterized protein YlzI (FlbEa/FlbD family)
VSFKRFTRPDGRPALINPDNVEEVTSPMDYHPPGSGAVIRLVDGNFQIVRETVEEVEEKLK